METIHKKQVPMGDRRSALAAAQYVRDPAASPRAFAREGDEEVVPPRASGVWMGSEAGLARYGLERGAAVELEDLASAFQGQHVVTGAQVRRAGNTKALGKDGRPLLDEQGKPQMRKVFNSYDIAFSVPKSVSLLWAFAGPRLRARIEQAVLQAAYRSVDFLVRTRPVVAGKETAEGVVGAATLHVVGRTAAGEVMPSPQLHVHFDAIAVVDKAGEVRALESEPLYKRSGMRLGGAIGRADLARSMTAMGIPVEACTGKKRRFFEIKGVPRELSLLFSGRSRDVERWIAEVEERTGRPVSSRIAAWGAAMTRQGKERFSPGEAQAMWGELLAEYARVHGMPAPLEASALAAHESELALAEPEPLTEAEREAIEAQARAEVLARLWAEGPTVSVWQLQAIAAEQATRGFSERDALGLVGRMEQSGELVVVDRWRVTSREIRAAERKVTRVAAAAGERVGVRLAAGAIDAGVRFAEQDLGGRELAPEQADAVKLLTSGAEWTCLTGRPGTGKGPVLKAAAAAYRREGWQVIACAADGSTASDLAHLTQGPARTLEQLRVGLKHETISLDLEPTVIVIEEASKVGLRDWQLLARLVEQHRVRVVVVGDARQMGAVECPGMLKALLADKRIPRQRLTDVWRHRDPDHPSQLHPWLGKEYHAHLYEDRALDAIKVLQREGAMTLCDSRQDAIEQMVERWDRRRAELAERYGKTIRDHVMIVYGENSEVDEVNRLAQARRLAADELGAERVESLDRGYRLHAGDVVMLRRAGYQPEPEVLGVRRPKRVENGTMGVITAVDPEADEVVVRFEEPDGERDVIVDMHQLRAQRRDLEAKLARGEATADEVERVPSLWLAYAGHPFPLQGKKFFSVSSLWGERYQRLADVISGDARAVSFLEVFCAPVDLDVESDLTPLEQMAERLKAPEHKEASVTYPTRAERMSLDPDDKAPDLPIVERWPALDIAPELPLLDVGTIASGPRRLIPLRDPLADHHRHLGPERLARIVKRAEQLTPYAARMDDGQLQAALDEAHESIVRLDPHAALAVRGIELDRRYLTACIHAAQEDAEQLEARAEALRKRAEALRERLNPFGAARIDRQRDDLLSEAAARHHEVLAEAEELDRLDAGERELRKNARHPDDWLAREGETLARALSAYHELVSRYERAETLPAGRERDEIGPARADEIGADADLAADPVIELGD